MIRWGLVPSWAKDPSIGNRMANVRSDTALEKSSFRAAMQKRRCLIPADVFFEWQDVPGQKRRQPYAVALNGGEIFALGGFGRRGGTRGWRLAHHVRDPDDRAE